MIIRKNLKEKEVIVEDGYNILGYYLSDNGIRVHNYRTNEDYEPCVVPEIVRKKFEILEHCSCPQCGSKNISMSNSDTAILNAHCNQCAFDFEWRGNEE